MLLTTYNIQNTKDIVLQSPSTRVSQWKEYWIEVDESRDKTFQFPSTRVS